MRQTQVYVWLTVFLLVILPSIRMPLPNVREQQLNCIDRTIQDAEVLSRKQLDVNQDRHLDDVVIYGRDELYVLVVVNQPAADCKVILNDGLTSYQIFQGKKQPATVTQVEMVDLTGDSQPELLIGLEGTSFFRESGMFHAIYRWQEQTMKEIFVSDQCLPMSSFEIQTASDDGARLIYLDEDRRCVPPSSRRDYEILRWSAKDSQFERICEPPVHVESSKS